LGAALLLAGLGCAPFLQKEQIMVYWAIVVVLLIMAGIAKKAGWKGPYSRSDPHWPYYLRVGLSTAGILLAASLTYTVGIMYAQVDLEKSYQDLEVLEKQYGDIAEISTLLIEKYPTESEAELLKSLKSGVLLQVPEPKSNQLLSEQMKLLRDFIVKKVDKELEINNTKASLRFHQRYWLFSPNLIPVEDF